jgi:hypothetical protein
MGGHLDRDQLEAGWVDRRGFLRIGGLTIAAAAVLAACGDDEDETAVSVTTTTTLSPGERADITLLRTVTSLELLTVDVYDTASKAGLLTTPATSTTIKLLQAHHQEHVGLMQSVTEKLGGDAFTEPNPVVAQALQPRRDALRGEGDVLALALDLEKSKAATYQAAVGSFTDKTLNQTAMSVGATESRHVALLAGALNQATPARAFQTPEGAVAPGTGV